jgi:hypothetical protein
MKSKDSSRESETPTGIVFAQPGDEEELWKVVLTGSSFGAHKFPSGKIHFSFTSG